MRSKHAAHAPELGDRFAEVPVALGTQRSVDGRLHDWHATELLAEHEAEGDEDSVV